MLEQEQALRQVLAADRKTCHLVPSWQDIEVLESVNKALSPLAEFTDILSGEEYVTVSSLRPLLQHLTETILKEEEDDTRLTKDIKSHVMTNLSQRYEDTQVSELANMAMILDPRFKSDYLDDNAEAVKEQVVLEELSWQAGWSSLLYPQMKVKMWSPLPSENDWEVSSRTSGNNLGLPVCSYHQKSE